MALPTEKSKPEIQYPLFFCTEPLRFLTVNKINIRNWEMFLSELSKLPTIPEDEKVILNSLVITIYGQPKIGKSTLCSFFNSTPTLVIDTIDNLVTFCTDYICKREEIEHPIDLKYGKGWDCVTFELMRVLTRLSMMGYCLILVGHNKMIEIETKTQKFHKHILAVKGGDIRNRILSMSNVVLYINSVIKGMDEVGIVNTKTSIYHDAGDQSKLLSSEIQYPLENPKVAYDEIIKCFNGTITK